RGQNWTQFNQNLPTVAIHEVAIHPDNGEIVVATHGRSLWACDVSGLRQLKSENIGKEIALFDPVDVTRWRSDPGRGGTNRSFTGQNPSSGAKLWYALPNKAEKVVARIENIDGELINEVTAKAEPGLHLITWDLTQTNRGQGRGPGAGGSGAGGPGSLFGGGRERTGRPGDEATDRPARTADDSSERPGRQRRGRGENPDEGANPPAQESAPSGNPAATQQESDAEGQQPASVSEESQPAQAQRPQGPRAGGAAGAPGARPPQGFQGFRGARPVPNGVYRVQLVVDGKVVKTQSITVNRDPNLPENAVADELYELQILLEKQAKENKYQNKSNGRGNYGDD
ncbi:MAG: hypothetical protein KGS49_12805, partial [Planctomycetes bacterium]|nr:hypothetical protein [Planctomycetota bacterium]